MVETNPVTNYSDFDFAQEVRTERLSLLWRVTMWAVGVFFGLTLLSDFLAQGPTEYWLLASAMIALGCLMTRYQLKRGLYTRGVWSYAGGIILAIMILLYSEPGPMRDTVPYTFCLLIVVVGLLLPPRAMPPVLLLAVAATIGVPALHDGQVEIGHHQWAALILTGIGALWAVQITGELYAIAEWALSSYQRERQRKIELHQSQLELKKTLAQAQVLAENLEKANKSLEQANVDLEQTNVELDRARKSAEEAKNFRGQFLANMSHELRTPLNAVIGFSETMLKFPDMYDGVPLPAEYHRDLEQIHTSGAQLLHVINDILDLSRVDVGKLDVRSEAVDLEPIFKATLITAAGLIGDKPIKLLKNLPGEMPKVWADPNRVRQVLLNLYSNAAKFTAEGSITLGLTVEAGEVVISVADTGEGIHEDEMELIFEEFRQGRAGRSKQHAGSGLGLTISRHLVRLMNGRIWVESQVGKGSTFYFTLPRIEVQTLAPIQAAREEAVPAV